MIELKLRRDDGATSTVTFNDCESMGEPDLPEFGNDALKFPWDAIPNEYGHMPNDRLVSPKDFMFKATMFGLDVEVLNGL